MLGAVGLGETRLGLQFLVVNDAVTNDDTISQIIKVKNFRCDAEAATLTLASRGVDSYLHEDPPWFVDETLTAKVSHVEGALEG